jgi:hypothetical protein
MPVWEERRVGAALLGMGDRGRTVGRRAVSRRAMTDGICNYSTEEPRRPAESDFRPVSAGFAQPERVDARPSCEPCTNLYNHDEVQEI